MSEKMSVAQRGALYRAIMDARRCSFEKASVYARKWEEITTAAARIEAIMAEQQVSANEAAKMIKEEKS